MRSYKAEHLSITFVIIFIFVRNDSLKSKIKIRQNTEKLPINLQALTKLVFCKLQGHETTEIKHVTKSIVRL